MIEDSKSNEILQYSFLVVFANDGLIDEQELAFIKKLALADSVVDDKEKKVLQNIFAKVEGVELDQKVRLEIDAFKASYNL